MHRCQVFGRFCLQPETIKTGDGVIVTRGTLDANQTALLRWIKSLPQPWVAAMEATLFTGWMYDFLKPYAKDLVVAHPEMLKAITTAKNKNDRADAEKICDLLRVYLIPQAPHGP